MRISPLEASAARQSFHLFVRLVFRTLHEGKDLDENWHIDAMCHALERCWKGEVTRLAIAVAPRALKSEIVSVAWTAFLMGHDPAVRIICASYTSKLAQTFHREFRRVLYSDWYQQVFPEASLASLKETGEEIVTAAGGYRYTTSVGGTLTGRGADYFVIDDPISAGDAQSEAERNRVLEWYRSSAYSRLDNKKSGVFVIAMQRLHVDDLIGDLIGRNPEEWEHLSLPSVAPQDITYRTGWNNSHLFRAGEALHPSREPLEQLERIRKEIGSADFAAQYLQEPMPPQGMLVRRKDLQFFDGVPDLSRAYIRQSWDTASKTALENDWSVCVTIAEIDGCHYVIDVFRAKLTYPALLSKAIELHHRHRPRRLLVEDTGIGTALIADLRRERINALGVKATESKDNRLRAQLPKIEAGRLLLPRNAPWLPEFVSELLAFPSGRHDDQVDALTQAMADEHQRVHVTSWYTSTNQTIMTTRHPPSGFAVPSDVPDRPAEMVIDGNSGEPRRFESPKSPVTILPRSDLPSYNRKPKKPF